MLINMEAIVRWCQHLRLINVVNVERLKDLRFNMVPNARLRHDGN